MVSELEPLLAILLQQGRHDTYSAGPVATTKHSIVVQVVVPKRYQPDSAYLRPLDYEILTAHTT
jgi:hypothetical protein